MNKYDKVNKLLYYFVMIFIFINIILRYRENLKLCSIYIFIYSLLVTNEYMRNNYFYKVKTKYFNSLIVSTILSSILMIYAKGYTFIFFFLFIYPIVMLEEVGKRKALLTFNLAAYFLSSIVSYAKLIDVFSINFYKENGLELLSLILVYFTITVMNSYFRYQVEEKIKLKKWSIELEQANEKLKEYSKKIEELTIESERNRVAQEIHDSLGHSLTALIMQLDYIEKILEVNPQRAKEITIKAQNSARNSMIELRQAVYCLKNNNTNKGLIEAINDMILNIKLTDNIEIIFNLDGDVEILKPEIKNFIYKTIQEGLTNGIKHGKAGKFLIELANKNNEVILNIKDNGQGCSDIIKGNGLIGMENRVYPLGGMIKFGKDVDNGFYINAVIPI